MRKTILRIIQALNLLSFWWKNYRFPWNFFLAIFMGKPSLRLSEVLQRPGPFKVSIILRPVLLEEAKGMHKWQIMHKLCLYHVSFVLCKWR